MWNDSFWSQYYTNVKHNECQNRFPPTCLQVALDQVLNNVSLGNIPSHFPEIILSTKHIRYAAWVTFSFYT